MEAIRRGPFSWPIIGYIKFKERSLLGTPIPFRVMAFGFNNHYGSLVAILAQILAGTVLGVDSGARQLSRTELLMC